ncbi:MAG: flavodoxin-dependent (E)-4-hydroxy-3-methylbut-2-enyl-diphosphate synthase [bacterium]|nr:flavodoxin-dependent (E)-4-hydroxy-3-methylbut-2-enyl-diphosphate synthase [bacterium]
MKRQRKKTRQVTVGPLIIGGDAPVSVQSMTSVPIEDVAGTIDQLTRLKDQGVDLVRLALRNEEAVDYLAQVIKAVDMPLSADIHFNYRIAIAAMKAGIHKIRINPGNIGDAARVREVVTAAKDYGVPIRIGVNAGSIDRKKYTEASPENLVESALEHVRILEDNDFTNIVVSIKSSDIFQNIEANKLFSQKRDYPLHIGLTEAGFGMHCIVQSSVVLGHLLMEGIGDTIRVSMTGDPVQEVVVGKKILESVGELHPPVRIISCPTCGRTDPGIDVLDLATRVEKEAVSRFSEILREKNRTITIAVMGCEVNGPGEAAEADVGLAGGRNGSVLLFAQGEKVKKIDQEEAVEALLKEVERVVRQ